MAFHPHVFARLDCNSGITTDTQQNRLAHVQLADSNTDVCEACLEEKQRRCRVVLCREEKEWLLHDFENAILLTPVNIALWTFANLQARKTSLRQGQQVVWIKTEDTPPASWKEYFLNDEALAKEQAKWLHLMPGEGTTFLECCPSLNLC